MIILLGAIAFTVGGCDRQKPAAPQANAVAAAPDAAETGRGVDRSHKGQPAPDAVFDDPDGEAISLAEFKGVPTLVNLWASWCGPCVKELPTLDALAASHRADGQLGVIVVSEDSGAQGSVKAFLDKLKAKNLAAYHDPEMKLTDALGVQTMPTTVLYDGAGQEVWRFIGDLDWTSAEAKALLAEAGPVRPEMAKPAK